MTVEEVRAATGFDLTGISEGECAYTREPTAAELRLIHEELDPRATRLREVPA